MMNVHKGIASALAAVMLSTTIAACSSEQGAASKPAPEGKPSAEQGQATQPAWNTEGFPIVNEPETLKIFARRAPPNGPYEEMLVFKEYEKMTNVNIEWEDVPAEGFDERKNLLFASNELPDAFYKAGITPLEAVRYGSGGMLIPLEDLIEAHAPNISALFKEYPAIRASITAPDGHIYALPAIVTLSSGRTDKHWLNTAWLQTLNMGVPETTDQLLEVLRAFRDNDPNGNGQQDEIPMSGWDLNGVLKGLSGSWGLVRQMDYNINIENDQVKIWMTDERYKAFLQYLNQLYTEGLLDRDVFTHKAADYVAKMADGNLGFFHNQASDPFASKKNNFTGISPVQGPQGDQFANAAPVARDFGTFAISSVNKHPEATIRWIDYFYSEQGATFLRYGVDGETFTYQTDGKPEYTDAVLTDSRGIGTTIGQFAPWPGGGAPHWINVDNSSAINPPEVQAAQNKMDPYLPKDIYGAPMFDEKTAKEVDTLRQDIDTFFQESSAKFITGSLSFDKWDEYVSTLEKMNLAQLEKFYQDAYDNTK
jgi:putative aldouronate transport system substrate-binding protein